MIMFFSFSSSGHTCCAFVTGVQTGALPILNGLLFGLRISCFTGWVLLGLLCIAIVYTFASAALRAGITRRWSRVLLVLCGLKTRVMCRPGAGGAALWVANHVSWVDVFVMNSVRGVSFISKDAVRKWHVIGDRKSQRLNSSH